MDSDETLELKKRLNLQPYYLGFSVLFFPGTIIGYFLVYKIFFLYKKWRPSVISFIFLGWLLFLLLIKLIFNPLETDIAWYWKYIYISQYAGVFIAAVTTYFQARQLRLYPQLRVMDGWAHDFKYAKTPWAKWKKEKLKDELKNGEAYSTEAAPMGVLDDKVLIYSDNDGNQKYYEKEAITYRYYDEAFAHTIATGSTGSGKTVNLLNLIKNDILSDYPVCVIDFKKGQEWPYFLSKWAKENDRPFYHFISGEKGTYNNPYAEYQATYDPLAKGSPASKADMILNIRSWDGAAEVYKQRTQSLLTSIFNLLDNVDKEATKEYIPWNEGGFSQFTAALEVDNLSALITRFQFEMEEKERNGYDISTTDRKRISSLASLYKELSDPRDSSGTRGQLVELQTNMRTILMSSYGDWLEEGQSPYHIDLNKLSTSDTRPVILFQFNPQDEEEFSKLMGSIIMADLSRASAYKNKIQNKTPFGVYIDEFQILDPMTVATMLEKARSSKFFITLSLQSLEQIVKSSPSNGIAVRDSITDTVKNFIVHDGSGFDSAENYSKIVGEIKKKVYRKSSGMRSSLFSINWGNSREAMISEGIETDWAVPPDAFQNLSSPVVSNNFKAEAFYITKACLDPNIEDEGRIIARKIHIILPDDLLHGVPSEFIEQYNTPKKVTNRKNKINEPVKKNIQIRNEDNVPKRVEEINSTNNETKVEFPKEVQKKPTQKRRPLRKLNQNIKPLETHSEEKKRLQAEQRENKKEIYKDKLDDIFNE